MNKETSPVFFDPSFTRGKITKRILILIGFFLFFLCINFILSIVFKPLLPQIPFPQIKLTHFSHPTHTSLLSRLPKLFSRAEDDKTIDAPINMQAFSVERDDASFQSLKTNLSHIEILYPEWMTISATGMQLINPDKMKRTLDFLKKF